MRYIDMEQVVADLKELGSRGFPLDEVQSYMDDTLVTPNTLDRFVNFCDGRYTRNLVHKDADFELLVICWGSGQGAPIHGHEGERCWARVERGKLRFNSYRIVSEEPLRLEPVDTPVDGVAGFVDGPADIHSVDNPEAFGGGAISLHVYSKPYDACDIYDSKQGPRRRVTLAYDSIDGEPTSTTAAAGDALET